MEQSIQLPNGFHFPACKNKMYFIHRPGGGWQLTPQLDPKVAIARFDQLPPPVRNDYLAFHKMMERKKPSPEPKTVKQQILEIRDRHIKSIEAIRDGPCLPTLRHGKVPRLDELEGATINITKYLHWTPMQISQYRRLCSLERLAVQGVAHGIKIGEEERERYVNALARVFPGGLDQQKDDGVMNKEVEDLEGDEHQYKERGFDPQQIMEDGDKHFFPGLTYRESLMTASEGEENRCNQVERSIQHHSKSTSVEMKYSAFHANQHSGSDDLTRSAGRSKRVLPIRKPKSPQTPTKLVLRGPAIADV